MINSVEKYKKTDYGYIIILTILIAIFLTIKTSEGNIYIIYPITILIIIMIVFYKLTIIINNKKIIAFFSFGFFKREMNISEIDFETIELIKINWLTGIGIRYTKNGCLYNVKYGEAIKIVSKDKSKTFFVGTDDSKKIKEILLKEIEKNNRLQSF